MTGNHDHFDSALVRTEPKVKKQWALFALVMAVAFVYIFAFRFNILSDRYILGGGDVSRAIYWMQKWQNPDLFANDPVSDYLASIQPAGLKAVYWLLSFIQNPVDAARWVPIVLFFTTIILLLIIGNRFGGPLAGSTAALAFLGYEGYSHIFSSGSASDFMPPLFLAICLCILCYRPVALAFLLIISALFYPSLCLSGSLIWAAWMVLEILAETENKNRFKNILRMILAPLPAGILLAGTNLFFKGDWGEVLKRAEMKTLPQFGPGGVEPFWGLPFWEWLKGGRSGFVFSAGYIVLIVFAIVAFVLTKKNKSGFNLFFVTVIGVCFFLFIAAHIVAVRFGFPTNYVKYTIPLLLVIWIGARIGTLSLKKNIVVFVFIFWIFMAAAFIPFWNFGWEDHRNKSDLFQSLTKLPATTVVAGHPSTLEAAATFSGKIMFVARQAEGGLHKKYLQMYDRRMRDFINAYYASDKDSFCEIAKRNHFDVLVMDIRHFDPRFLMDSDCCYAPYHEMMRHALDKKSFYLLQIPQKKKFFERNGLSAFKVDCDPKDSL